MARGLRHLVLHWAAFLPTTATAAVAVAAAEARGEAEEEASGAHSLDVDTVVSNRRLHLKEFLQFCSEHFTLALCLPSESATMITAQMARSVLGKLMACSEAESVLLVRGEGGCESPGAAGLFLDVDNNHDDDASQSNAAAATLTPRNSVLLLPTAVSSSLPDNSSASEEPPRKLPRMESPSPCSAQVVPAGLEPWPTVRLPVWASPSDDTLSHAGALRKVLWAVSNAVGEDLSPALVDARMRHLS